MGDPDLRRTRFAAVVLPHLDPLLAFARRRTAAEADAEDAVQDACVRAWRALDELREDAQGLPWLYQILRHVLGRAHVKGARRNALPGMTPLHEADAEQLASDAPGALDALITAAATEEVARALRTLPEQYATAVELRDLEGLSCREVATVLGVPVGTALSRIHRGRRLLAHTVAAARATDARRAAARRTDSAAPHHVGVPRAPHAQGGHR